MPASNLQKNTPPTNQTIRKRANARYTQLIFRRVVQAECCSGEAERKKKACQQRRCVDATTDNNWNEPGRMGGGGGWLVQRSAGPRNATCDFGHVPAKACVCVCNDARTLFLYPAMP
ncbi:hypothetical protein COCCADRAFT_23750 [Bipolaris zeicola 26-R-13]|uniref:Uncharacterized protein n=1 Tax=Cochliobolus carbonum (strain 26-R-13) TaxID=930089 RepID=W6YFQ0_COCC2|nr:uncharacterized protein COCCADRAFT_23750 [Bipolaris zeicola 26-R-13]EUC36473.1 hypothetical protein COCCADRAFT_23750 [Bipolaris zeicola 26-R-13]